MFFFFFPYLYFYCHATHDAAVGTNFNLLRYEKHNNLMGSAPKPTNTYKNAHATTLSLEYANK